MSQTRARRPLRVDTRPLYLQLVEALFDWIDEEGLQPGDPVPGEPELARIFDVGRSTVREAMVYLEYEGIVDRSQGFRTTLTSLARQPALGLEVLEPVEVLAKRQGWTCETRELMLEQREADITAAAKLGVEVGSPMTFISRVKTTDSRPFALMESFVPEAIKPFAQLEGEFRDSITRLLGDTATLRFATSEIDALTADTALARKLGVTRGKPVLLLEEVFFGDSEQPLAWNRNYLVPGIVRLEILRKSPIRKLER